MAAVSRTDITNKQQTDVENAEHENSFAVFSGSGDARIRTKQGGGSPNVHYDATSGNINSNAGVVMPHDDTVHRFNTPGKA